MGLAGFWIGITDRVLGLVLFRGRSCELGWVVDVGLLLAGLSVCCYRELEL